MANATPNTTPEYAAKLALYDQLVEGKEHYEIPESIEDCEGWLLVRMPAREPSRGFRQDGEVNAFVSDDAARVQQAGTHVISLEPEGAWALDPIEGRFRRPFLNAMLA